jgi:hypothetical protein
MTLPNQAAGLAWTRFAMLTAGQHLSLQEKE